MSRAGFTPWTLGEACLHVGTDPSCPRCTASHQYPAQGMVFDVRLSREEAGVFVVSIGGTVIYEARLGHDDKGFLMSRVKAVTASIPASFSDETEREIEMVAAGLTRRIYP